MILSSRYKNDGVAVLPMNDLQRTYIQRVQDKISNGVYRFETVPCAICGGSSMDLISQKDRYGFDLNLAICKECGLAQTNPRMDQESYNQFYNQEYRFIYGGESGPTEAFFNDQYVRLGKKIFSFVTQTLGSQSIKNLFVLEIGCGAGGILKYFKDNGCAVKGIDLGEEFIAYGKKNHGLDLMVGDIKALKIEKKPDVIIYSHVLEHILDLKSQLNDILEIMHKDTLLYIEVPGLKNLHRSYEGDLLLYLQNAHVYHFTKTSLLNLMHSTGFENVTIDEFVRSIFKKADVSNASSVKNEYFSLISYLKKIERMRKVLPVPIYVMKFQIKRSIYIVLHFFKLVPALKK